MTNYAPGYVQYGQRLDCDKEGCMAKQGWRHADDGQVVMFSRWENNQVLANRDRNWTINGHAAVLVTRTMPEWDEVPTAVLVPDVEQP